MQYRLLVTIRFQMVKDNLRSRWYRTNQIDANSVIAPDGTITADVIPINALNGQRIFQRVDYNFPDLAEQAVTFSLWARTLQPSALLALTIKSAQNSQDNNQEYMDPTSYGELLKNNIVRFQLSEEWQRYWVTLKNVSSSGSLHVMIYIDGYYASVPNGSIVLWGAQLNVGSEPKSYISTGSGRISPATFNHFHNIFIQSLYSWGAIGLLSFLLFLGFLLNRKGNMVKLPTFTAFLITQFFDNTLVQSSILFSFIFVVFALCNYPQRFSRE